jgi:hypothetical protein
VADGNCREQAWWFSPPGSKPTLPLVRSLRHNLPWRADDPGGDQVSIADGTRLAGALREMFTTLRYSLQALVRQAE